MILYVFEYINVPPLHQPFAITVLVFVSYKRLSRLVTVGPG